MLQYETLQVGILEANCYIVYDSETRKGLVIDPGGDAETIHKTLERLDIHPQAIFLTHAHFDHIGGIGKLTELYSIPTWVSAEDLPFYNQAAQPVPSYFPSVLDLPPAVCNEVPPILNELGGIIIHTPGHTPGGVCFYFPQRLYLFSGDTLFCHSVGRTDFPGGNEQELWNSIHTRLFSLPGNTIVFPGHGNTTTIEEENS